MPDIFLILVGMLWILLGLFKNKVFPNKYYFVAFFSVNALWGLMLLYIFLFRTDEYLMDINWFYFLIGLFILLSGWVGMVYIRRRKEGNL
ncbi:LPXTG cell wall anchor domain-containing protein [Methanobacterium alcaliphilum]|uniref:LPXTG cell wall anchor domain-containing protein n=1 Tax=Methanobacterium alcaliphilum TaxID=392018 RepID=UPI00200A8926|nr:LPXTG cell wall anchor domain-containing protein [Methanobacterium alcaliphilum]MCK9150472.1 LPXTG cell wall anchor domain-containing protein [Methanobacterium alcaliphilum]